MDVRDHQKVQCQPKGRGRAGFKQVGETYQTDVDDNG